jgi:hypothetical protein
VVDDVTSTVRRFNAETGTFIDVLVTSAAGPLNGPTFARIVPRPQFTQTTQFGTGNTISIAWTDWNLDGKPDAAVGFFGGSQVTLHTGNGDGTFVATTPFGVGNTFAQVWADVNQDGRPDLAIAGYNTPSSVFLNNGDGSFTRVILPGPGLRTTSLAWGDFDNDGDLDLAAGNGIVGVAQQNYLYVNDGAGGFTARPEFGLGQTDSVAWGDFDNDGDLDLAVGNGGFSIAEQNALYVNNGDGTFTARNEFGVGDTASVSWGDFDTDGDLDLAVGNWNGDHSLLYVNKGDGTFSGGSSLAGATPTRWHGATTTTMASRTWRRGTAISHRPTRTTCISTTGMERSRKRRRLDWAARIRWRTRM